MAKQADAKTMSRTMVLQRTTKGTAVYAESESAEGELFPTVYIQKSALGGTIPETLTLTVTV